MGKLSTPDWIREGFDSKADWEKAHGKGKQSEKKKGKTFKVKTCPECGSTEVGVILGGEEGRSLTQDKWECKACKWKGKTVNEKEMSEDEFMEHLDRMDGK